MNMAPITPTYDHHCALLPQHMLRNNYCCYQPVPIYNNMNNDININQICIYFIGELTKNILVHVT